MIVNNKKFWLVIAVFLGTFIGFLDITIVNVSLPAIQGSIGGGMTGLQWVVNAYTICLSIFMLSGGTLGDRYGRKRLWLIGLAAFTIGSAVCAWSPSLPLLISGRIIQGTGAAILLPGAMSILAQAFTEQSRRAQVFGWWNMINGLATIAGPVLGGILVDMLGWHSIFLVNLPLGVLVFFLSIWAVPESADPSSTSLDPLGQLLSIIWLGSLVYALIMSRSLGWSSAPILSLLSTSVIGFFAFIKVELRNSKPMLPIRFFTDRRFSVTNVASFIQGFGVWGVYFFLSLYLQQAHGYSASVTGLRLVPFCGTVAVIAVVSGWLTGRFGPQKPMLAGYLLTGCALLGMDFLEPNTSYLIISLMFVMMGVGMGLALPPINIAAIAAVPRERSGMASATVNAARQTGSALGIAIMGVILFNRSVSTLSTHLEQQAKVPTILSKTLAIDLVNNQGVSAASRTYLSPDALKGMFKYAFCSGLHAAVLVAGIATIVIAVLIWATNWQYSSSSDLPQGTKKRF